MRISDCLPIVNDPRKRLGLVGCLEVLATLGAVLEMHLNCFARRDLGQLAARVLGQKIFGFPAREDDEIWFLATDQHRPASDAQSGATGGNQEAPTTSNSTLLVFERLL